MTVQSKTVSIPAGSSFSLSVSASATFAGPHADPHVSIDQHGTVGLNAGGAGASVSDSGAIDDLGADGVSYSDGGVSATSSQTSDIGPDRVTTSITATLRPNDFDLPGGEEIIGGLAFVGGILAGIYKGVSWICNSSDVQDLCGA